LRHRGERRLKCWCSGSRLLKFLIVHVAREETLQFGFKEEEDLRILQMRSNKGRRWRSLLRRTTAGGYNRWEVTEGEDEDLYYKEQLLDDFEEDEILCYGRRLLNNNRSFDTKLR
jgi:hypothetical protein